MPERQHEYHAEATVLSGHLRLPFAQPIEPQAHAKVPAPGGYLSQHTDSFRVEGIVSYSAAHTQVSGHREVKEGHGWKTLATSVVENLNVLHVVTADRIVGQISTEHPLEGYVPKISFLGTHFDNLRIAGHPVKLSLDLNILDSTLENEAAFSDNPAVMKNITDQHQRIRGYQNLPAGVLQRYNQLPAAGKKPAEPPPYRETIECSLVNHTEGGFPGKCFGHVIDVPNFGKIYLATLCLEQWDFNAQGVPEKTQLSLTMIDIKMGCIADGETALGRTVTNGGTHP